MTSNRVFYVWDENLIKESNRLPAVPNRASLTHELIMAYNLHEHNNMTVVRSKPASYEVMREFHSQLYLDHLKTLQDVDEDYVISEQDEEYGIGYDCPPVANMFELVSTVAGGSVTAARSLTLQLADVAINWCGGWHHASRFGAEGFCYINDIVLAIEQLRQKYPKVLYIDLDVHHGNGVQDAFSMSKSVITLSIHKLEPGFYPGTGTLDDIGLLTGKGYTINMPLKGAYSDETFCYAFEEAFRAVYHRWQPDAIVVQCGADSLAHDPHGGACLTLQGYCTAVGAVLRQRRPTLLLGGGGYNFSNAARLWTSITALALGVELDDNIPEHEYWTEYSTDYSLTLAPTLAKDPNDRSDLIECINVIIGNLNKYLGTAKTRKEEVDIVIETPSVKDHNKFEDMETIRKE